MQSAVIYARYSSDAQTEQSIEGQLRVCNEYAKKNNFLIVETYIDRAVTGTTDNRVAFQKMIRDSYKKQWKAVIVYKLDRFSRNRNKYESVVHKKTLKDNGVKLISAMENIPDSPEGTLMEALLEGFNQYYSEELAQKVNRGIRESWLKGNSTGGLLPFGYDRVDKKFYINEYEADALRRIFTMYSQGYRAQTIAEELEKEGVRRKNGDFLTAKAIYRLLHNSRYTGKVVHDGVEYDNIYPRIISDELWYKVNKINEENVLTPGRKKEIFDYILSGKLICGICKRKMSGESGTSKTGDIHYYYICLSKRKKRQHCTVTSVNKQWLEDTVINATVEMLKSEDNIRYITTSLFNLYKKESEDNSALKILVKQREEALKASDNMIKAIEQGIITEQTKTRLKELETTISRLDFEIDMEKQKNYAYLTYEDIENYLRSQVLSNPDDIAVRKLLVNTFIREILYYPDKIIITYNSNEHSDTVKFTDEHFDEIEKQADKACYFYKKSSSKLHSAAP